VPPVFGNILLILLYNIGVMYPLCVDVAGGIDICPIFLLKLIGVIATIGVTL
jgi:hypothetical protein